MSSELLEATCYYAETMGVRNGIHEGHPVHTVIQDIESFFWVLLYLCLTRGGPVGGRREELDEAES